MELPKRKKLRLEKYDYNQPGAYFITICTKNRQPLLSSIPTPQNSIISRFISTFKRFCNKKYGQNIWQPRSYDHIIRDEDDYREIWAYIDNNPLKWQLDRFFQE